MALYFDPSTIMEQFCIALYKFQNENRGGIISLTKLHLFTVSFFLKLYVEYIDYKLAFSEFFLTCFIQLHEYKGFFQCYNPHLIAIFLKNPPYCSTCYLSVHTVNSFQGLCQWVLLVLFEVKVDYSGRSC